MFAFLISSLHFVTINWSHLAGNCVFWSVADGTIQCIRRQFLGAASQADNTILTAYTSIPKNFAKCTVREVCDARFRFSIGTWIYCRRTAAKPQQESALCPGPIAKSSNTMQRFVSNPDKRKYLIMISILRLHPFWWSTPDQTHAHHPSPIDFSSKSWPLALLSNSFPCLHCERHL